MSAPPSAAPQAAGAFWAMRFRAALGLPANLPGLVIDWTPDGGGVSGIVLAGSGLALATVGVAAMTAGARAHWLARLGLPAGAPCPPPTAPSAIALARVGGPSPVPNTGAVEATCRCGGAGATALCSHVIALLGTMADQIARDPLCLWRWRRLDGPLALAPRAARLLPHTAVAPRGRVRLRRAKRSRPAADLAPEGVTLAAYLGMAAAAGVPDDVPAPPWQDRPRALARLGPLPHASGQREAVAPIEAVWRAVRDMLGRRPRRLARPVAAPTRHRLPP